MLIRSQDKTTLIDTTGMIIGLHNIGNWIIAYGANNPSDDAVLLGDYTVAENAIEVLDEIQNNCRNGCTTYQMPW